MSWDPTWEDIFRNRQWGRYPPEELVRFTARRYFQALDRKAVSMLEIGCGAGANIWFLAREGFDVHVSSPFCPVACAPVRLSQALSRFTKPWR